MTVLRVDPIACEGHGTCAELLPELVTLDEWGYPIIHWGQTSPQTPLGEPRQLPPGLERVARKAVAACPVLALKLVSRPPRKLEA